MVEKIKKEYINIFRYAQNNLLLVGILGFVGFPTYYLIWKYIYPQHYETISLRLICSLLFLPWVLYNKLPEKLIRFFPVYFFFSLFISIPLFFTYMLFANKFSDVWLMSYLAAVYLAILLLYHWWLIIGMFSLAAIINIAIYPFTGFAMDSFKSFDGKYIPIYLFAIFSGILCHRTEIRSQFKIRNMKSFGGGIAHEMRNPLNAINLLTARIRNLIIASDNTVKKQLNLNEIKEIDSNLNIILGCTSRASEVIEMILANLKEKVKQKKLEFLSAADLVSSAVKEYGFDYESQIDKIILNAKNNFVVKADKTAFTYMIFNLIRNALYYLNSNKDGFIKISLNRGDDKINYNQIIVEDNGPGISDDKIKYIFDSFYTSGKEDGVGLGLDFCKKAMESFGGKIECNSKINDFTKFILSFPKLSDSEINKFLPNNKEEKFNYFSKNTLIFESIHFLEESNHFNNTMKELEINTNFFREERAFLSELKLNYSYDLLLINIDNNENTIFDLIARIRKINNDVPIIVYNANQLHEKELINIGVDEVIMKNQKQILSLERSIAKWNLISKVPTVSNSIIEKSSCLKKILLADDDSVNRMILSKNLQKYGFEIDEVINGKQLKDKLFDEKLHYDLVITDINMPIINGDEVIKNIRNFRHNNHQIPVIVYSGDGGRENIHKFLKCGVSDFFVKGDDVDHLIDLARFWTN